MARRGRKPELPLLGGLHGTVVAMDPQTGAERWRTKLKGMQFVNVACDADRVYAATQGQLWCLDVTTGTVLWQNKLSGLGFGIVSMARGSTGAGEEPMQSTPATTMEAIRRRRAASAAS